MTTKTRYQCLIHSSTARSTHHLHQLTGHKLNWSLTPLIHSACSPWLRTVKMCVSSDARSREVSMGQEAALAIEWCAVAVEALSEEEHDVCVPVHLAFDVTVGDLPEPERNHTLPDPEGLADGLERLVLPDFRAVVLYTEMRTVKEVMLATN